VKISKHSADYVLVLKDNQESLHKDAKLVLRPNTLSPALHLKKYIDTLLDVRRLIFAFRYSFPMILTFIFLV